MTKFVSASEAVAAIKSNAVTAVGGFCGFGSPDELLLALRERYLSTAEPKNLTLFKGVSVGDKGERGCSRIALDGLIGRVICAHVGLEPPLAKMVEESRCLAYMLPLGTCTELLRAAAAKRPGVITTCGLETFADPRLEGSKANKLTVERGEDIVSLTELGGEECLYYKTLPIDVCLLRGSLADELGNISIEREAMHGEQLEAAAAAHNSGGLVIVQVEDVVKVGTLDPQKVVLHHFMVDYVVKARPENHTQGYDTEEYRPYITGECRKELDSLPPMPLNDRKVCGRRAFLELREGDTVNLGIGMPDSVAAVASEEGVSESFTLSIESGVLGGVPLSGLGLGGSVNPDAVYRMADILNIYDGGGLDCAVLGLAEMDSLGNVNVSSFGGRVTGPGGFIDIAQNTETVIFVGTFTAGGLKTSYEDGRLHILREGRAVKFRSRVEQVSFSGSYAIKHGKKVLAVTERAVFRLTDKGLELIELAPGAELERDVLAHMEFRPIISPELREMDAGIFREGKMLSDP